MATTSETGSREALHERDASILHPHSTIGVSERPLIIVAASGATLRDADGKEYVDGTCGLWQCPVGHGREELAAVAAEQIRTLEFFSSFGDFSNPPAILLAERLLGLAPPGYGQVFFTNGGSEGTESAIKLARLAWSAAGHPERNVILSRSGAYHGMSSAALSVTGLDRLRAGYGSLTPGVEFLAKPHALLHGDRALDVLIDELEERIDAIGADRIAALIGEPVLGVGGMVPPPEGYWPRVQQVLRRHGIMLIADEIVTAFGRTGHWFASPHFGLEPDLIVTAKGLTSGYFPMGAVLVGRRVLDLADGADFLHGFTYNGHPVGAAVALANLDIIERERLLDRARVQGEWLLGELRRLESLDHVVEVRGLGLMLAIELDRDAAAIQSGARADGVIVRAAGNNVLLSPPLVITDDQLQTLVRVLADQVAALAMDNQRTP